MGILFTKLFIWGGGGHFSLGHAIALSDKKVVVLTRSTNDLAENCSTVFNDIVSCVMEAKVDFCHSVRLEFFLLDSTSEADYHSADNLFVMRDVERVLTSAEGRADGHCQYYREEADGTFKASLLAQLHTVVQLVSYGLQICSSLR